MNILIVTSDFKPNPGGIAEFTHQLAHHWQLGGDSVMVLSPRIDPKSDADFDARSLYRVKRFDYSVPALGKVRRARVAHSALMDAVREHSADLILNNSAGNLASFCWLVSRTTGIPFCLLAHGRDVNRSIPWTWRMKQWVVLRGTARVFCNSSCTARAAESRGARSERITVVNPGFSLDGLEAPTAEQCAIAKRQLGLTGRKVVLTVGRLVERKGNDKIIEALPMVRREISDVLYVVVGGGPCENTLMRRVRDLGLEDQVRFAGYVPDCDKPAYYKAADVFAMPSREMPDGDVEGFGMVFLEANAYGKPVIGGRSGGIVDAVDHGRSGFLVNPLDSDEIGATIIRLLKDEQLSRQMGEWGRQRVLKDFNWGAVAARMRERLARIIDESPCREKAL